MITSLLGLLALLSTGSGPAVTMVSAAAIHTVDPQQPKAEAFVFDADGLLLAVGTAEALVERYPEAGRLEFPDATIVPGLIDAHGHVINLGLSLMRADLVGTRSRQEIIERLRAFDAKLPEDSWLLGRGWDQNDWSEQHFPSREDLDAHFPERPVWLTRIDGHAGWGNSAALAAIDRRLSGDWQPEGGRIIRDEAGAPTGVFIDRAMDLVDSQIPPPNPAELEQALDLAFRRLAAVGLTGVHDAGVSLDVWRLYQRRDKAGRLPLRIHAMADGDQEMLDHLCQQGASETARLQARSVKLYADGALGSRGAALIKAYADDPPNRGLLLQEPEDLAATIARAMGCGLQVNTHAIGDRANRVVLDLYAQAMAAHPDNPGRHRIEHAQVLAMADIERLAKLGVIASMQPTHATSDMYWAEDRLGSERLAGAYAWRRVLDSGARLALGSDFPVERANPLLGIFAAVSRQDLQGEPEGGWLPDQRLDIHEALRGFTLDAAYAGFAEQQVGSLEVGKRADFVVLAEDIATIPPERIPHVQVLATYLDGKPVYQAKSAKDALPH